ncbi:hypothetical protein CYMTET_52134 [Cymbomonas tetramitiformis]|uniref:Polycystin cation channel PKD1/PKD2 domain-containing protein n=1 Tax=Cymbomonas tetramitiformis TaxID=36881 RepID=A0AAE0BJT5_9CHLO|nr:hypothetical protein CYMTET_52134 [Cymbomonas tetramitiformis]
MSLGGGNEGSIDSSSGAAEGGAVSMPRDNSTGIGGDDAVSTGNYDSNGDMLNDNPGDGGGDTGGTGDGGANVGGTVDGGGNAGGTGDGSNNTGGIGDGGDIVEGTGDDAGNAGGIIGGAGNTGGTGDGGGNTGGTEDGGGNTGGIGDGVGNVGGIGDGSGNTGGTGDGASNAGGIDDGAGNAGSTVDGGDNAGGTEDGGSTAGGAGDGDGNAGGIGDGGGNAGSIGDGGVNASGTADGGGNTGGTADGGGNTGGTADGGGNTGGTADGGGDAGDTADGGGNTGGTADGGGNAGDTADGGGNTGGTTDGGGDAGDTADGGGDAGDTADGGGNAGGTADGGGDAGDTADGGKNAGDTADGGGNAGGTADGGGDDGGIADGGGNTGGTADGDINAGGTADITMNSSPPYIPPPALPSTSSIGLVFLTSSSHNSASASCCMISPPPPPPFPVVEELLYDQEEIAYDEPPDAEAPVITLHGQSTVEVLQYEAYVDPGASVLDLRDGVVEVVVRGLDDVDTSKLTTEGAPYLVSYAASDSAGNTAVEWTRQDQLNEELGQLHLIGQAVVQIAQGSRYAACDRNLSRYDSQCDPGATATDAADGLLTQFVTVCATPQVPNYYVNRGISGCDVGSSSPAGLYNLTFGVENSLGQEVTVVRSVVVEARCAVAEKLCDDQVSCSVDGVCLADLQATAASSSQQETASATNTDPIIALVTNEAVTRYVDVKQYSEYAACGVDQSPTREFLCEPGAQATDAEDGNLTAEILSCPPPCVTAVACSGHRFRPHGEGAEAKGIQGCLNTSAEVGTMFQLDFVVYDFNYPAASSTVSRYITIVSTCDIGEFYCDGVCSPLDCAERDSLLDLFNGATRRRLLQTEPHGSEPQAAVNSTQGGATSGNSEEELRIALAEEVVARQAGYAELEAQVAKVQAALQSNLQHLAAGVWAEELMEVWVARLEQEMANQANLLQAAEEALRNIARFVQATALQQEALAATETQLAASQYARDAFLDMPTSQPPPPPSCNAYSDEPRELRFNVPTSDVQVHHPAPACPPPPTSEAVHMLNSTAASGGEVYWPSPEIDEKGEPPLAQDAGGVGSRRHLQRAKGGGGKGKSAADAVKEGPAVSEDGGDGAFDAVVLDDSFKVSNYLARRANRVTGGMSLELRRQERVLPDSAACTTRFRHLNAPCQARDVMSQEASAQRYGLDPVFNLASSMYDPAVVMAADAYYNTSNKSGHVAPPLLPSQVLEVRISTEPYFPYPFVEREGVYTVWIDAGLVSQRAQQLLKLMEEGNFLDSSSRSLVATLVTYQASHQVFAVQRMEFLWMAGGYVRASYHINTVATLSEWSWLDLLIALWAAVISINFFLALHAWLSVAATGLRRQQSAQETLAMLSAALLLDLQSASSGMSLWGPQLAAAALWYYYQRMKADLTIPMEYAMLDSLYAQANYLLPQKENPLVPQVPSIPRWALEDDDAGTAAYARTLQQLDSLHQMHAMLWCLQSLAIMLVLWSILKTLGFHKRMNFVLATLSVCASEAGAMASRLLESMEDVRREAEHLSTVGGQGGDAAEARSEGEQSGASPEQAMALAEGELIFSCGGSGLVHGWGGAEECTVELANFFFVLGIIEIEFGMLGHILFGAVFEEYSAGGTAITNALMFVVAGDWGLLNPILSPHAKGLDYGWLDWAVVWSFVLSHIILSFLVLLNMLMAILGDAQAEVKEGFEGQMKRVKGGLFVAHDDGRYIAPGFFEEVWSVGSSFLTNPMKKDEQLVAKLVEMARSWQCMETGEVKIENAPEPGQHQVPDERTQSTSASDSLELCGALKLSQESAADPSTKECFVDLVEELLPHFKHLKNIREGEVQEQREAEKEHNICLRNQQRRLMKACSELHKLQTNHYLKQMQRLDNLAVLKPDLTSSRGICNGMAMKPEMSADKLHPEREEWTATGSSWADLEQVRAYFG